MQIKQIGIDIGKNSFHVIGLGMEGDIVLRRQFTRSGLIAFFKQKTERLEIGLRGLFRGALAGASARRHGP